MHDAVARFIARLVDAVDDDVVKGLRVCLIVLVATSFAPISFASSGDQSSDLLSMDVEELMDQEIRLNAMILTNIHHAHEKGEWMMGFQYMHMGMSGNLVGTEDVGFTELTTPKAMGGFGYMAAPTDMSMDMYMFGAMYAPTNKLTVMAMIPYVTKSMDLRTSAMMGGVDFTTRSQGVGDLKTTALYSAWRNDMHRLIAELGVTWPTGSIDQKDSTPMSGGKDVRLPYPMQIGSGSFGLLPGATYLGQSDRWIWGAHIDGTIFLGKNENDYRLGNRYEVSTWAAYLAFDWASVSVRPRWKQRMNIEGADPSLNPMMVLTADPDQQAGRQLDFLFGVNLFVLDGVLKGHKLAVEGGVPAYQSLDGPQMKNQYLLTATWNLTF